MISSVSRDNAELAINALKLGASDYIEKPSLGNIAFKTEEIHNKLKSIHEFGPSKLDSGNSVSFQKFHLSEEPDHSLRIILFSLGSREKAFALCRNIGTDFAPTILLLDAPAAVLHSIAPEFELVTSKDRLKLGPSEKLVTGNFYLKDLESGLQETIANAKLRNTSLLLAGKNSSGSKNLTASIEACQVLFEDLGEAQNAPNRKSLKQSDVYFIPLTSFLYQSAEFFTKAKKKAA
jgi:hypothetical protein